MLKRLVLIKEMTLSFSLMPVMYEQGQKVFQNLLLVLSTTWRNGVLRFTFFTLVYLIFVKSSEQAQFGEKFL